MLKFLLPLSLVTVLIPAMLGQNTSDPMPPEELVARIQPAGIRADMEFLADDLLEGRLTGTRGYDLAALYVRTQFEEMGLKPAGLNGSYLQPVRLRKVVLTPSQSSMTIEREGKKQALTINQDFAMRGDPLRPDSSVEAPVVFVGYGVTAPEYKYDDYSGADVHGKIVMALYGAPPNMPTAPGAVYSDGITKLKNAAAHGAVGFISLWGGRVENRIPFSSLVHFYDSPAMRWLDAKDMPNDAVPQIRAVASINSKAAARMFEGTSKSYQDVLNAALKSQPQNLALPVTVAMHSVSQQSEVHSTNIVAVLPGSDPKLSSEYVVFSAHADHMGVGTPTNGDAIYNGAVDNASGTAALLEIARAFSEMKTPPRRSLLFLVVTGEEEGLLGSDYYAHYPTVPLAQIVADVNMDGVALLYEFRDIVPLGADHSSLGPVVEEVAKHFGLKVSPDPAPEEVGFIRSDQYSFVKQGVPSVFVGEGWMAVDPKVDGKKLQDQWEATRYHTPGDDMQQPLDFKAAALSTRVDLAIGYAVAQQDARPQWNAGDFFQKYAKAGVGN